MKVPESASAEVFMIYFTSDLHLSHENVIKHSNRPFHSVEEMDRILIKKWNERVTFEDEIYILGDFTLKGPEFAMEMLTQLAGKKYFIKGNHDRFVGNENFVKELFVWMKEYHELTYKNQRFALFHYPIAEWNHFFRRAIHLHGHQHNAKDYNLKNREDKLLRYDVGVDANGFAPVSIEEILDFFKGVI